MAFFFPGNVVDLFAIGVAFEYFESGLNCLFSPIRPNIKVPEGSSYEWISGSVVDIMANVLGLGVGLGFSIAYNKFRTK